MVIILVRAMLDFTKHVASLGELKQKCSTNTAHKDHEEKLEILSE